MLARVAARAEDRTGGPAGKRCHGPSVISGCCGYSGYTSSSFPTSPACITAYPVRRSVTPLRQPPRAGSASTRKRSFATDNPSAGTQFAAAWPLRSMS